MSPLDTARVVVVLPWVEGTLVALERPGVPLGELCYLLRRRTHMTPEDRGRFQITPYSIQFASPCMK